MEDQTQLFVGRENGAPTSVSYPGGGHFFASTTWMLRRTKMDDFKVRAACRHLEYRQRISWHIKDEDGDPISWVLTYKPGRDGKLVAHHAVGPDGKPLFRKRGPNGGSFAWAHDPPKETFPSHRFPSSDGYTYVVTGDDGTTWRVGSRGNEIDVLRQEILNNPILWAAEKTELLAWLDGPRKLTVQNDVPGEAEAMADVVRTVDRYFCDRIMNHLPVTEEEIQASGLPDETIENLVYNLLRFRQAAALRAGA